MAVSQSSYPQSATANLHFVANEPSLIPTPLLNPHAAFWLAPVASDRSKGDLAEVGYFVRWNTVSEPGIAKAQLCRFIVDPADSGNYQIYSSVNGAPINWLNADTLDLVAPATVTEDYRGWLADNVIALWLRCLDRHGNPIVETAEGTTLNNGYGFDSRKGFLDPSSNIIQTAPRLPVSVEIVLVTVDAHIAKRITRPLYATPDSPDNLWKDRNTPGSLAHWVASLPAEIQPGVQVFSTRVLLKESAP